MARFYNFLSVNEVVWAVNLDDISAVGQLENYDLTQPKVVIVLKSGRDVHVQHDFAEVLRLIRDESNPTNQ